MFFESGAPNIALELKLQESYNEGFEEGLKEGFEEGFKEGLKEGQVLYYHESGRSIEEIAEKVGISIQKVETILSEEGLLK